MFEINERGSSFWGQTDWLLVRFDGERSRKWWYTHCWWARCGFGLDGWTLDWIHTVYWWAGGQRQHYCLHVEKSLQRAIQTDKNHDSIPPFQASWHFCTDKEQSSSIYLQNISVQYRWVTDRPNIERTLLHEFHTTFQRCAFNSDRTACWTPHQTITITIHTGRLHLENDWLRFLLLFSVTPETEWVISSSNVWSTF